MIRLLASAALLGLVSLPSPAKAECGASIVTGLDVSASINREELLMQLDGLTAAIQSPIVLSAIQSVGCARMAVFIWSDGPQIILLPWTEVGTVEQAEQASAALIAAAHDYTEKKGSLTDVSSALGFAWQMLNQIPPTGRQVVNLVSNGEDNTGEGPEIVRAAMLAAGVTINAVLFGPVDSLPTYYRTNVTGGASSFVMRVKTAEDFAAAWRSKFRLDLAQVVR